MTTNPSTNDHASVVAPPPFIYLTVFLFGMLIHWRFPMQLLPPLYANLLGWTLIILAILLMLAGVRALRAADTALNPYGSTTAIVTAGPYRYSRNPLYLSLTLLYLGTAGAVNSPWPIVTLPVALFIMYFGVIFREEHYLERKFGEVYLQYKRRVRRWL